MTEVADASGFEEDELFSQWHAWAEQEREMFERTGSGLATAEYRAVTYTLITGFPVDERDRKDDAA